MSTVYELELLPKKERTKYYWHNGKLYPKTTTTFSKMVKAKYKRWFKSLNKKQRDAHLPHSPKSKSMTKLNAMERE